MKRERRVCPKCGRYQYHQITEVNVESRDFVLPHVEETCEVCGSKRLVYSNEKILKPRRPER